ncbi:hypothetical protein G6735_05100 [Polynucleobacter paneuropaeus]|nr:hypothetical protein [Polynucleobacter paneuropaeus]
MKSPFSGFKPEAFQFLEALTENQNRIWFAEHRKQFDGNPRTRLMTANLNKISPEDQKQITLHAQHILNHLDEL